MFARIRPIVVLSLSLVILLFTGCDDAMRPRLSREQAGTRLSDVLQKVEWREATVKRVKLLQFDERRSLLDTLPDIDNFAMAVDPIVSSRDVVVEIFSATEKSGTGPDGWLVEVAEKFNKSGISIRSGRAVKIRVRKIASGTGYQYIAARNHTPHAITPSNHLWVEMIEAAGIPVRAIDEKLVGNIAGIFMKEDVYTTLESMYGRVGVKAVIDATVNGEIAMGYTNPFASSTGLNFLVTVLADFAGGDESRMLTPEVVSAFRSFQNGVPFVAFTTLQMRDSVRSGGALDAFVMEWQTFAKVPELKSGYRFVPFGLPHDNPLYGV